MNDKEIKDKGVFVIGFLAVFLAVSSFKDDLRGIQLAIGDNNYSLFHIIVFFVVLLTISAYLYALDYLKYSFPKYQNLFLFKWIIPTANFFYSVAILFPILVLMFWIVGSESILSFTKEHKNALISFDAIGTILLTSFGVLSSYFSLKKSKKEAIEIAETLKVGYLQKAIQLFKSEFYGETVVEVYKVLEQILREKLLKERNLTTRYISIRNLIELAFDKGILDKQSVSLIKELTDLRNKGVHSSAPVTKEDAEFFINSIRTILENEKFKNWSDE